MTLHDTQILINKAQNFYLRRMERLNAWAASRGTSGARSYRDGAEMLEQKRLANKKNLIRAALSVKNETDLEGALNLVDQRTEVEYQMLQRENIENCAKAFSKAASKLKQAAHQ